MVRFAYPFFTYPLPDDTVETGRRTTIIRHGNVGCSFVAVRIVRSELTHEQLEAYFEDIGFAMPHGEPFFMDDEGLVRVLVWEDGPFYRLALIGGGAYIMDWPRIGCR